MGLSTLDWNIHRLKVPKSETNVRFFGITARFSSIVPAYFHQVEPKPAAASLPHVLNWRHPKLIIIVKLVGWRCQQCGQWRYLITSKLSFFRSYWFVFLSIWIDSIEEIFTSRRAFKAKHSGATFSTVNILSREAKRCRQVSWLSNTTFSIKNRSITRTKVLIEIFQKSFRPGRPH